MPRLRSDLFRVSDELKGRMAWDLKKAFGTDEIYVIGSQSSSAGRARLPHIGSDVDFMVIISDDARRIELQKKYFAIEDEIEAKYAKGIDIGFPRSREEMNAVISFGARPEKVAASETINKGALTQVVDVDAGAMAETLFNRGKAAYLKSKGFVVKKYGWVGFTDVSETEARTLDILRGKYLALAEKEKEKVLGQARLVIQNGVAEGKGIGEIAKQIDALGYERDAELLARTEIISAAKQGQLDAYGERKHEMVELSTAADACEECKEIESHNPYTIEEARAMGKIHFSCRCSWVPLTALG